MRELDRIRQSVEVQEQAVDVAAQQRRLRLVPKLSEETFTELVLTMPAGVTALSVLFSDYSGSLAGPSSIATGANLQFHLLGSTPNKPYILLLGQAPGVVPLSLFDPGDHRDLLISLSTLPIMLGLTHKLPGKPQPVQHQR